ncbi:hypothetical protein ACP275_12G048900 [Erythranthe tilingii]
MSYIKMQNTMGKYMLQLLFIASTLLLEANSCFLAKPVHVWVANNLPNNSPQLQLHCASRDNDLGDHTLNVGQNYNFKFCARIRTLFFCHLWWNNKNLAFDVYSQNWGVDYSSAVYYWEARSDGIYLSQNYPNPTDFTKKYDW